MPKLGLVLTADYELFGNGSGSIENCLIRPTERMARIIEEYGGVLTLFVDVCEYWAFESEFENGKLSEDWAKMIRDQLQGLALRGHDIQLHMHPQWLDYSYDGSVWKLNYDYWRISSLKYTDDLNPDLGLERLFKRGKQTLESIIKPVRPDYKCFVFRAGSWCLQPEQLVLRAMTNCGIFLDSTVLPNMHYRDSVSYFDFRGSPSLASWKVVSNVLKVEREGLIEVPIFTTPIPIHFRVLFLFMKLMFGGKMSPSGCTGQPLTTIRKSKISKIFQVLFEKHYMLNFSDGVTMAEMKFITKKAIEKYRVETSELIPIVAISHPKSFSNNKQFTRYLKWIISKKNLIGFIRYGDLVNYEN